MLSHIDLTHTLAQTIFQRVFIKQKIEISFSKYIAQELGPHGITPNAVAPGLVLTDVTKQSLEDGANTVRFFSKWKQLTYNRNVHQFTKVHISHKKSYLSICIVPDIS